MRLSTVATLSLAVATLVAGCSTAPPRDDVRGFDGVETVGEYVRTYQGDELLAALGYRYAAGNAGAEWLLLDLALSAPSGASTTVEREDISVVTPAGRELALADHREFAEAWDDLRGQVRRAQVMSDPLEYFPGGRQPCPIEFFKEPTAGITFDEVTVDYRRACEGLLFFRVPGGVQPGAWTLRVDLEETTVEIPFTVAR